jgi:hypothetical protein
MNGWASTSRKMIVTILNAYLLINLAMNRANLSFSQTMYLTSVLMAIKLLDASYWLSFTDSTGKVKSELLISLESNFSSAMPSEGR